MAPADTETLNETRNEQRTERTQLLRCKTLPDESKKKKNALLLTKFVLPKYRSNDVENCLVLFSICPISFIYLRGVNWPFVPVEMGDFLQKASLQNLQKTGENTKQDFPLFSLLAIMTLGYVHVFCPGISYQEENFSSTF